MFMIFAVGRGDEVVHGHRELPDPEDSHFCRPFSGQTRCSASQEWRYTSLFDYTLVIVVPVVRRQTCPLGGWGFA